MARPDILLTGVERTFGDDEIIVSKTDVRGVITYANDVFCRVAGYREAELLGQPPAPTTGRDRLILPMQACYFAALARLSTAPRS